MLLPDASPQTVFKVMLDERDKVQYYIQKEKSKKNIKPLFFTSDNQIYHSKLITIPSSGNRYLIWIYFRKNLVEVKEVISGSALMMTNFNGTLDYYILENYIRYNPICKDLGLPQPERSTNFYILSMFTGHFLSRYRERAGIDKKLSAEKLAIHFFSRNMETMVDEKVEKFNGRHKTDDKSKAIAMKDGYSLSESSKIKIHGMPSFEFIKHNTFITEEMLTLDQKETQLAKLASSRKKIKNDIAMPVKKTTQNNLPNEQNRTK